MTIGRKQIVIGGTLLLLLGSVGAGYAWWHGGGPGHFGGRVAEAVLWRMDDGVEELDLNQDQQAAYKKIREEIKAGLAEAMEKRREAMAEMKKEIEKDKPDPAAMAEMLKARMADFPDRMSKNLDRFVEFYNILNEEQKAKVLKKFRKHMSRMEQFNPGFGPMGRPSDS